MIIEPKTRGFICLTAHPEGCKQNVLNQIKYVQELPKIEGGKRVLVIGASTGFGLASRIVSAYGCNADTIGVYFEKPPKPNKTASPGWYNTSAFEYTAQESGLYAKSINGDAFSDEIKNKTIELIQADWGKVDLVIYSLASPVRLHPKTGIKYKSTLKPIGKEFQDKTVDFHTGVVKPISIQPAVEQEIANTVAVMGGEDWEMWMNALFQADVLSDSCKTVAYSYIGPDVTAEIYRKGTIGQAKLDLEATVDRINSSLASIKGSAFVSVNKALVTQASSAIPVIPLYISLLYKVMKEKGIHEGCIEQIHRLYNDHLYESQSSLDDKGRIRIDDWEMRADVQEIVAEMWLKVSTESLSEIGDLEGYSNDFYNLFGFRVPEIDYTKDVNEMVEIPGLQ